MADSRMDWMRARIATLEARVTELETKLKYHSATYSEGGSGEYINNSRFEDKP